MNNRIRLIWLALTAPQSVVDAKANHLMDAMNNIYVDGVQKRLDKLNLDTWTLEGVSIGHNGEIDSSEIHEFLRRAPQIIKNLIEIINHGKPQTTTPPPPEPKPSQYPPSSITFCPPNSRSRRIPRSRANGGRRFEVKKCLCSNY